MQFQLEQKFFFQNKVVNILHTLVLVNRLLHQNCADFIFYVE